MDLVARLERGLGEFVLFALTPPRASTDRQRVSEIADATMDRLRPLGLDGLILYDIDDESERNPDERPFPFVATLDPAAYRSEYLGAWETPVVVYRSVGKYPASGLASWLADQDPAQTLTVFVGASSSGAARATSLSDAYRLLAESRPMLALGGVAIPERHHRARGEHLRLLHKQEQGCRFFVTQVVFDVNASKNLVSDYFYECQARGVAAVPVVFTFSVCGSMKTLEFLRWLGVEVPHWIENELRHASDTLEASYQQALANARELIAYCRRLGMPFGVNVESVSNRRVEIEASVELARVLRGEVG